MWMQARTTANGNEKLPRPKGKRGLPMNEQAPRMLSH